MKGRPSAKAAAPAKPAVSAATVAKANSFLDREALLDQAIHTGVIGTHMRAHYAACYDADPEGTRSFLGSVGYSRATAVSASDDYNDSALSPQERNRIAAAREGTRQRIGGEGL